MAEFAAAASCSAWSAMALMADDAVLLVSWRSKKSATVLSWCADVGISNVAPEEIELSSHLRHDLLARDPMRQAA